MSEPTASSIYDLGYRHYDGNRTGRGGTLLTLYAHALRTAFGLGRRWTSKVFPVLLSILAFVPALIQLGVGAITSGADVDVEIFKHEDYFQYVQIVLILFCAAVAPELVGRDQRNRSLSLYFSRAVSPLDYVAAKLAALTSAMLVLTLGPQLVLFVGNGMADDNLQGYLRANWDLVFPIVAGSIAISATIASVGVAIASSLPRRAYSTAAIVAVFVLTTSAAHILMESADPRYARAALLVSPVAWDGMIFWLFQVDPEAGSALARAALNGSLYALACVATIVVAFLLTLRRFVKVST